MSSCEGGWELTCWNDGLVICSVALRRTRVEVFGGLESLPLSIMEKIADQMSLRDWARASSTCKGWWAVSLTTVDLRESNTGGKTLGPEGDADLWPVAFKFHFSEQMVWQAVEAVQQFRF